MYKKAPKTVKTQVTPGEWKTKNIISGSCK